MGELWQIIQDHIDAQPYHVSDRAVAKALDVAPTALGKWKHPRALPDEENLRAISRLTGASYMEVLEAALRDVGYLPKESDPDDPAPKTAAEWDERAADLRTGPRPLSDREIGKLLGPRPTGEVASPGSGGVAGQGRPDQRRA